MKKSPSPTPRPVSLNAAPHQIAQQLSHLPGLIFFDTVGHLPAKHSPPISIISAKPTRILTGHITQPHTLQKAIAQHETSNTYPFPTGALCGSIDYDGHYTFGNYPHLLIYQHQNHQWWEIGTLTSQLQRTPANQSPTPPILGPWQDSLPQSHFTKTVKTIKEYIAAGDIYQVNLSRRLRAKCHAPHGLFPLYQKLRDSSPAPTASYLHLAGREILSSSPETFLRISQNQIETRPIKGTRPRFTDTTKDKQSALDLLHSEKERAELIMITDLLRNDLGQVCHFGSVHVTDLLRHEKLPHLHHLVSTIRGTLTPQQSHLSALSACFPGGSITGAPKKRATEIISQLEPVPRGLYTGAIGYLGFNAQSQFNIAIRTLIHEHNHLDYHVGAGIVSDSDPLLEFQETEHKARGLRLALSHP